MFLDQIIRIFEKISHLRVGLIGGWAIHILKLSRGVKDEYLGKDIDLMCDREDIPQLIEILTKMGFKLTEQVKVRRGGFYSLVSEDGSLKIDVQSNPKDLSLKFLEIKLPKSGKVKVLDPEILLFLQRKRLEVLNNKAKRKADTETLKKIERTRQNIHFLEVILSP